MPILQDRITEAGGTYPKVYISPYFDFIYLRTGTGLVLGRYYDGQDITTFRQRSIKQVTDTRKPQRTGPRLEQVRRPRQWKPICSRAHLLLLELCPLALCLALMQLSIELRDAPVAFLQL